MMEHVITENLKQENGHNSGELVCSCGRSASITHNKKTSLTIARARLRKMHEAPVREKKDRKITTNPVLTPGELRDLNKAPKKEKVDADFKKPRSTKKLAKQQKKVQKIYEEDEDTTKEE